MIEVAYRQLETLKELPSNYPLCFWNQRGESAPRLAARPDNPWAGRTLSTRPTLGYNS